MTNDSMNFSETANFDELDEEAKQIQARRLTTYSKQALRAGVSVDAIHVHYPSFVGSIKSMDRMFQIAREVKMAHGLMLIGPPGSGKSAIFRYFRDSLPTSSLFAPGLGAIGIRAVRKPTVGQIVTALLRAYRYPFAAGSGSQLYVKRHLVFDAIRDKGTRLIFVDEAQHLVSPGRPKLSSEGETSATEFLRELMDETNVALVLAGSTVLDDLAIVDKHLKSRVSARVELSNFPADQDWLGLLKGFAKQCEAYDLSTLLDPGEARLLHRATEGNLRSLKRLLTEAVLIGIDTNQRKLNREIMKKAFDLAFGSNALVSNVFA